MSSSRRGVGRSPAVPSASNYVRTLDIYPIRPTPSSSHDADRSASSLPPTQVRCTVHDRATHNPVEDSTAASTTQSGSSSSLVPPNGRIVTEEDYRLSPQEIQQRVQATLLSQVRSLLETRLQQRLQKARQVEAQQRMTAQTDRSAAAVPDAWPSSASAAVKVDEGVDVHVEAEEQTTPLPKREEETLSFTASRLLAQRAPSAATDAPSVVDPKKYAETVNAHPYSAVELVRVHRLKGIPYHNRGLFAGLSNRPYTTRSGHLVVNPNLDGKGRVRSAVSWHVWEEQRRQQQLLQQQGSAHLGAAVRDAATSIAAPLSHVASSVRSTPLRLVMKVVGEGDEAAFTWTEDDTVHSTVDDGATRSSRFDSTHSVDLSLDTTLVKLLERKYGKPLTKQQKVEAERRLRERRRKDKQRQEQTGDNDDQASADDRRSGKKKSDARMGGDLGEPLRCSKPMHDVPGAAAVVRGAVAGGGADVNRASSCLSAGEEPLIIHDFLLTIYDKDSDDNLARSDGHSNSTLTAANAALVGTLDSFTRLPPGSASAFGGEAPPPNVPREWRANQTFPSRADLSVSELGHTVTAAEAQELHRDRQARTRQSAVHENGISSPAMKARQQQQKKSRHGAPESATASSGRAAGLSGGGSGKGNGKAATSAPPHTSHSAASVLDMDDLHHLLAHSGGSAGGRRVTSGGGVMATGTHKSKTEKGKATATDAADGRPASGQGGSRPITADKDALLSGDIGGLNGDTEHAQLDAFLRHFPEAESHVQLRREAKTVLDELEDMWDEDSPTIERPFPLPQFSSMEFHFPGSEDGSDKDASRPLRGSGLELTAEEPHEEPVVGFEVDLDALQKKFRAEAMEEYGTLTSTRDALLADVVAQRQLISDFSDDVHFISVGSARKELSAEQYAIELTREVNAYAKKNHMRFRRLNSEDEEALHERATLMSDDDEDLALVFLERFGRDRVPTRDVGCQVSDADLCYVDAGVRSTEAQLEILLRHEKALFGAVRLATVAVANILSFHASLEMESTCHECFFVFDKPRTLWPCGHTFCHACLSTMYNNRGDLICSECGSAAEVGYTPNLPMELIANYQTVYTRVDADSKAASNSALAEEREAQTVEGVLRNLLSDLISTQHSWKTAPPTK